MNWYVEYIEEPVRNLVKLLRNNGFNTVSSCGHEMYVQCEYLVDGELQRLHNLLFNSGYRNYTITVHIQVMEGHLYQHFEIKLPNKNKEKESLGKNNE